MTSSSTATRTGPRRGGADRRIEPALLTAEQAAARMGVAKGTFYAWLRSGRLVGRGGLKVVRLQGRTAGARLMVRYVASSIDAAIARLAEDAPVPGSAGGE